MDETNKNMVDENQKVNSDPETVDTELENVDMNAEIADDELENTATGTDADTETADTETADTEPKASKKTFVLNIKEEEFADYGTVAEEKDKRLASKSKNSKKKKMKKTRPVLYLLIKIAIAVLILAMCVLGSMAIINITGDIWGLNQTEETVTVKIEPNTHGAEIAEILADEGVIDYPLIFRAYLKYGTTGVNFKFGEFTLYRSMPYLEVINILQSSTSADNVVSVTIPEGYNVVAIANKLEESGVCSVEDFLEEMKSADDYVADYPFLEGLSDSSLRFFQLEGYIYPDTYEFYMASDPKTVVAKFLDNFAVKFTDEYKAQADAMGASVDEIITLASMIQKEATLDQMGKVSSVFWNRLNSDGEFNRLQSNPTSDYAKDVLRAYGASDEIVNEYDTYVGFGLPEGAICNPSLPAIEAALNPENTDYYYFCTDLSLGQFFYAHDYDTHQQNMIAAGLVE